jgi:6,7-dimethyl-8-ribityllumazine synthase
MTRPHRSDSRSAVPALAEDACIAVVVSQYHRELTEAMAYSAWKTLEAAGLPEEEGRFDVVCAPGAFELPILARELAASGDYQAVLCFGVLLKGETSHDYHIASAVSHALQQVALDNELPVLFGLLTCDTLEQARARALPDGHDKGREVALAAIEVVNTMVQFGEGLTRDYWNAAKAREELRRRS